jgi:serine/threonine-protein phosphatase 2A activator
MIKMYKAEVLGKLPVMQHFLFGTLLPPPDLSGMDGERVEEDEHGHVHGKAEKGWTMDCCGIPGQSLVSFGKRENRMDPDEEDRIVTVPSAFAAAAAEKGETPSTGLLKPRSGLKPIPFD